MMADTKGGSYMARRAKEAEREHRIVMEAVVDAYGPEEQALGWYYYLEGKIAFPFKARCVGELSISPLRRGEEVMVYGMAPEEECQHDMFVMTKWQERSLAAPLSLLEALTADEQTVEAVEDWRYWVARGYTFG